MAIILQRWTVTSSSLFFFNGPPTPQTYTLSLHDALPISVPGHRDPAKGCRRSARRGACFACASCVRKNGALQGRDDAVLLLVGKVRSRGQAHALGKQLVGNAACSFMPMVLAATEHRLQMHGLP